VTGLAAAVGLLGLLLTSADITHRRAGYSWKETAPAMITIVIGVACLCSAPVA
jgi:hypothetical protein